MGDHRSGISPDRDKNSRYQASVLEKHTSIVNGRVCVLNAGQWMTQSGIAGYENNAWVCASVGTEPGKETKPKKEQGKCHAMTVRYCFEPQGYSCFENRVSHFLKNTRGLFAHVNAIVTVPGCCFGVPKMFREVLRTLLSSY